MRFVWGIHRRIVAAVMAIAGLHASPRELFTACVVGAVIGCTPLYGLHFALCAAVAALFGLNLFATYAAANVSIPPLAPFVGAASVTIGGLALYGTALPFDRSAVAVSSSMATLAATLGARVFVAWLVGAPVVGLGIGAALGAVVATIAHRRGVAPVDPVSAALDATVARYHAAPRHMRHYVRFKTRLDPVYRALATELPDSGTIVDLGTGLATLPILLASLSERRTLVGVEWDADKAAAGKVAATGLPVRIDQGDVRTWDIPACDAVTIIDVLHYFPPDDQRRLLARARAALQPGGCLLVRELDTASRSRTTRMVEDLTVRFGWNRASETHFRTAADLARDLTELGFAVEQRAVAGTFHPGNVLLRATC